MSWFTVESPGTKRRGYLLAWFTHYLNNSIQRFVLPGSS